MKKSNYSYFILLLFSVFSFNSYSQLVTPRASPSASVTQKVGITDIAINYSRPSVKEREIWGNLVPYGLNDLNFGTSKAAPWRAGANENTTIHFSDNVIVEGKPINAGTYGLHLIVQPDNKATVILSTDTNNWGSYFYDPAKDALRADITSVEIPHTEMLTYSFTDVTNNTAVALLSWEKLGFPVKIEVDVTQTVLDQFRNGMNGQMGFNRQNWEQAAAYALNNDGDLDEALIWVNKAMEGNFFSQRNFNNVALKAQIMKKMGNESEFNELMEEASSMANLAQLNTLGYQMLNFKEYDRAIKYFEMAIKMDPSLANSYDSLGEAYRTMGEKDKAIKAFKKALSMNPPANVKANSEKHLKELQAM